MRRRGVGARGHRRRHPRHRHRRGHAGHAVAVAGSRHRGHPWLDPGMPIGHAEPQRRRLRRLRRHLNQRRRLRLAMALCGISRISRSTCARSSLSLSCAFLSSVHRRSSSVSMATRWVSSAFSACSVGRRRPADSARERWAEGVALGSHLGADLRDGYVLDEGVDDAVDVLHGGDESGAARGLARLAVHLIVLRRRPLQGPPRARRWARAHPAASAVAPYQKLAAPLFHTACLLVP